MKNKITTKKIKSAAKKVSSKTKVFVKTAEKKAGKIADSFKKEWKKEQPQREELMRAGKKALENGLKIGGDVLETIKKDIAEISSKKNK